MNILIKGLNKFLIIINGFLDNLDKKYVDMIRQLFFLIVIGLGIGAIIFGFIRGRSAAQKGGIRIINTTNDAFDIDIQQEKEDFLFKDIMEKELRNELNKKRTQKDNFFDSIEMEPERSTNIFEEDMATKEKSPVQRIENKNIEDVPLVDTKNETDQNKDLIIEKDDIIESKKTNTDLLSSPQDDLLDDNNSSEKDLLNDNSTQDKVNPVNKNNGIIE